MLPRNPRSQPGLLGRAGGASSEPAKQGRAGQSRAQQSRGGRHTLGVGREASDTATPTLGFHSDRSMCTSATPTSPPDGGSTPRGAWSECGRPAEVHCTRSAKITLRQAALLTGPAADSLMIFLEDAAFMFPPSSPLIHLSATDQIRDKTNNNNKNETKDTAWTLENT